MAKLNTDWLTKIVWRVAYRYILPWKKEIEKEGLQQYKKKENCILIQYHTNLLKTLSVHTKCLRNKLSFNGQLVKIKSQR